MNRMSLVIRKCAINVFAIAMFDIPEVERRKIRQALIRHMELMVLIQDCIRKGYKRVEEWKSE